MIKTTTLIKALGGTVCATLTTLFGGLDAMLIALLVFVVFDYITGIIAAIIKGNLSSKVGFSGLLKKVVILIIVAVAHTIGQALGFSEIRSLVTGFYIANEGLSILENAGRIGVPLPQKLLDVLEQLKSNEDIE